MATQTATASDQKSPQSPPAAKDWTTPAAMAIPKGGFFEEKVEQGRYGPIYPQTPACYGFSCIAKVIPGREEHLYNHAKIIEKAIADDPDHPRHAPSALSEMGDLHHQRVRAT